MKTAIATVSLSGTMIEKLEAISAAGFKGVEIFENDLLSFSGTPSDLGRIASDLGLSIITFQPFRDFEGLPEAQRIKALSRAERKFDLMQQLGCDLLLVCSNVSPDAIGGLDRAAADFRKLGELAEKHGIRVGFEALAWGRFINDYRDSWEVVRRADHRSVGLVLDTFHILARGTSVSQISSIPKDKIFLVQMADAPKLEMDYLSWSRHYRCFPGQGDFPLEEFMASLHATGFDELLSLEIFSDRFRAGSARSNAVDAMRSFLFLFDQLRKKRGIEIASMPSLPPISCITDVEFLEFAMDEEAAKSFEAVLAGMGFERAGIHKSKEVTHWCQGDVHIVVNCDKEGFAHSFNIVHGSSVCAMGLRVEDANATFERAQKLLDQPFHQVVGPGELKIPAVRGVGGSLIYFIDDKTELNKLWEIDFNPGSAKRGSEAGIVRIDHISQLMQYEEMLTWLLFYTSIFDLKKRTTQDVIDPGGVVQSQALESDDGLIRLILNSSQSRQTQASQFVEKFFGSGVQQIALATDDIFATVERLRANAVKLLPIPENYYEDLEARTDLTDTEIERLRTNGILYDCEGSAEFFHIYTQTLEGGFFFEIVERRGYRGYGAANASIRLAAQARLAATSENYR